MFRLKDERLHPDLHDGGRLHGCGDGKKSSRSPSSPSVPREAQALQPAVEVQSLKGVENVPLFPSIQPSVSSMCSRGIMRLCADVHDPSRWIHVTILRANKEFIYLLFKIFFPIKTPLPQKNPIEEKSSTGGRRQAEASECVVPEIQMCYPGGSEGDNKSFFRGKRSSLQGCFGATSSRDHYCRTRLHRNQHNHSAECRLWRPGSSHISTTEAQQTNMRHTYTSIRIQIKRT